MSGTGITIGGKGRIVLPAALRERRGWGVGTELVALESETGVVLVDRDSLKKAVRAQLVGRDVVTELLDERRVESFRDEG